MFHHAIGKLGLGSRLKVANLNSFGYIKKLSKTKDFNFSFKQPADLSICLSEVDFFKVAGRRLPSPVLIIFTLYDENEQIVQVQHWRESVMANIYICFEQIN